MQLEQILEDFAALEPGEERLRHLIDLGRSVPGLPEDLKSPENLVIGCQGRAWIVADSSLDPQGAVHFRADSEAIIPRGIIAVVLAMYDGRTPAEILSLDSTAILSQLGMDQLTMGRRVGIDSMVRRVRAHAASLAR